jgi:hypothetical protein
MPAGVHRRPIVPLAVAVVVMATLFAGPVGAAATPTLRLFVASTQITVERGRNDFIYVDPGAWITPDGGGSFELRVSRPDYDTPVTLQQVDAETADVLRTFDAANLEGWSGLKDFAHYQVLNGRGEVILSDTITFCPNSYIRQRLSDDSPLTTTYPYFCGGGPFTRGMIWGIDEGWASALIGGYYYGLGWRADHHKYTIEFEIDPAWVDLLSIAPGNESAEVQVLAVDRGTLEPVAKPDIPAYTPYPKTPIVTSPPDPASAPDLVALPGWGISTYSRKGHDYLGFNSTEWNAGPGTMVVEGFRGTDDDTMDAFQYFLVDGEPIGRAQIGELEFHAGGGHNHWHFEEFTQYSMLDAAKSQILISGKQSWCLVNTDALDLTLPNANLQGYGGDLFTSCGGPGALWVREVLDVGWGDTYGQYVKGQAFDITDLPNGRYYIRVHVNPTGSMFEASTDNNIEDRLIRLRGKPGNRRVIVPPWHGIDTENYCYYCG